MSNVLTATQLCKSYRDGQQVTEVLHSIDLTIKRGDMLAIVGSSGSGKSTLLHILGTLDQADSGSLSLLGQDVARMTSPQKAALRNGQLDFTALENVAMPLLIRGLSATAANQRANMMLERVGLSHRSHHKPAELSGGERQRVAIARALVGEPALLLADEPTGNLDQHTAESIYQLLRTLNRELGTSFIVVTHDLALAARLDRHVSMRDGRLENPHG
jgi:lipoprotein-releasing system ATP-binding protein